VFPPFPTPPTRRDSTATQNQGGEAQNPRKAERCAARAAHRAEKAAARASHQAARREAKLQGVPLAPPTPGQIKVQLKRIGAQQAQLRVKLGEVTVQRLRLQVRRAEALAGGAEGAAPEGEAPAPEAEGGEAAPAPPPPAAARLEAAKRQLRVMRVDAALSKLEVKAQKFVRLRWGGGVAFSAAPQLFLPHPRLTASSSHNPTSRAAQQV
jgi:hypothetical protein